MNAQITSPELTDSWRQWLRQNIDTGCSKESMVEAMAKSGFTTADAEQHIADHAKDKNLGSIPPLPKQTGDFVPPLSRLPEGHVIDVEGHKVQVMLRMKKPLITILDNVLTPEECEELMRRSSDKLKRNTTVDPNSSGRVVINDRTSHGTFWQKGHDEFIASLDRRMALLTGHPVAHFEGLQVMRYQPGGEYKAHFDYFPLEQRGSRAQMGAAGQRVATLLMYLQAPEEGGETEFPDQKVQVTVVPKQGSAVFFEYMDHEGRYDPLTLHAGKPVLKGEKWIATRWIRERTF
jgi:prolyl 4-hydroxylase